MPVHIEDKLDEEYYGGFFSDLIWQLFHYFSSMASYDFILAIGDDKTDEDLFQVLPAEAVTIKIGLSASLARYKGSARRLQTHGAAPGTARD